MSALLSTTQAAKYLGLTNATVITHARTGNLTASFLARRWKFKQEDLEAFVNSNRRSN